MNLGDLLTPWLLLAGVIIPLVYVEKWIHAHLYGVGWLLTNDKKSATALYYVLLFPGVVVHEFTQYLVAGALNVKIKRVIAWPQAQNDGTLRLDFVQIKNANRVQAAIIGAAPLFAGLALVWVISSQVLNLDNVVNAIGTGSLDTIGVTLRDAASAPDFLLWIYVIFTISNAMLPTPTDRQGWPLLVAVFAVVMGFLVLIGVGDVLMTTFTGPVAHGVNRLTTAFATVLVAEVPGILAIGFGEEILERTTKRKFEYGQPSPTRSRRTERQAGSNLPLPAGTPLPSIYNLDLPIPSPSEVKALPARSRQSPRPTLAAEGAPPASDERPAFRRPDDRSSPAAQPDSPLTRRSIPAAEDQPAASDERPAFRRPDDRPSPAARPDSPLTRRSTPPGEDQPAASDERPAFRRPDDRPSPAARPDSPLTRRSTPPGEDQPAASGERPAFRRPDDRPSPAARPDSPLTRRSAPASADQPPARPAFRTPAETTSEDNKWLSGLQSQQRSDRPPPNPVGDATTGDPRRPSPPLTRRPSPFAAGADDDDDEDIVYEDFDDDSVIDNIYGDDDE